MYFQAAAESATTALEHQCLLDIDCPPPNARNTSIICTIGPVSRSVEKLTELILVRVPKMKSNHLFQIFIYLLKKNFIQK